MYTYFLFPVHDNTMYSSVFVSLKFNKQISKTFDRKQGVHVHTFVFLLQRYNMI